MNLTQGDHFSNLPITLLEHYKDDIKTFIKNAVFFNYYDHIKAKVHNEDDFNSGINLAINISLSSLKDHFVQGYRLSDDFVRRVEECSCACSLSGQFGKSFMTDSYYREDPLRLLRVPMVDFFIHYPVYQYLLHQVLKRWKTKKRTMACTIEDFSRGLCLSSDMMGIFIFELFQNPNKILHFNELVFFKIIRNSSAPYFYENSNFPYTEEIKAKLSKAYSEVDFISILGCGNRLRNTNVYKFKRPATRPQDLNKAGLD